ncbi:MAG: VapE domain-containing protein [Bacteroidota bacterium]
MKISLFYETLEPGKVRKNQKPVETISVEEFADRTITGIYKKETDSVRKHPYGSDAYKKAKLAKRHYVTMGGVFGVRKNAGIREPSGVYCLDIDHEINQSVDFKGLYKELQLDKELLFVFRSFNGIKVLLRGEKATNSKEYEARHKFYSDIFGKRYQVALDDSMVRISQPCFCSYDPEAEYNEDAPYWSYQNVKAVGSQKQQTAIAREQNIDDVLRFCEFLTYRAGLKPIEGQRHNFIVNMAFLANEYGVEKSQLYEWTKAYCPEWYDNPTNAIDWPYENRKEAHGTKKFLPRKKQSAGNDEDDEKPPSKLEFLQGFIPDNFDIRFNEFTSEYEFDKRPIEDKDINDITNAASQEYYDSYGREINKNYVFSIIESSFTEKCNPVRDYFESVKITPQGAIDELISTVETDHDSRGNEKLIKKWLINVIALGLDGINNPLLPALLGNQNTGKTEFWRRLVTPELKEYYTENPIEATKDNLVAFSRYLIWMDDELSGKARKDVEKLKAILSREIIKLRKAYGRKDSNLLRRTSFCGTGNEMSILHDYTGNRRIIPVHVKSIDHAKYNAVNKNDLWGEAYQLYLNGEDFRLTKGEVMGLNSRSTQFEYVELEIELVNSYLTPGEVPGPNHEYLYTTTDLSLLFERYVTRKPISVVKLGRALKKLGFEPKQVRKNGSNPAQYYTIDDGSKLIELQYEEQAERDHKAEEEAKDKFISGLRAS